MLKRKNLVSLLAVLALSSSCFADENEGFFLGAELGVAYGSFKDKNSVLVTNAEPAINTINYKSESINAGAFDGAIKVGYRFNPSHRAYISLGVGQRPSVENHVSIADSIGGGLNETFKLNNTSTDLLLGYDFSPSISDGIKGLLGVYAGYSSLSIDGKMDNQYTGGDRDIVSYKERFSGFAYGVKAGFIFDINENNEIDLSLRYTQRDYSEKGIPLDPDKIKPTSSETGLYIGYAYKF